MIWALALFSPAVAVALIVMICVVGKWVFEGDNGQRR